MSSGLHNLAGKMLDEIAEIEDQPVVDLLAPVIHSPLATTPEAVEVAPVVGNHIYVGAFTIGTTPQQIAWANPNRLKITIQKGTATVLAIGETYQSLIGGANASGFTIPSGFYDLEYSGDVWAVASGAGLSVTVLELLRTAQ